MGEDNLATALSSFREQRDLTEIDIICGKNREEKKMKEKWKKK